MLPQLRYPLTETLAYSPNLIARNQILIVPLALTLLQADWAPVLQAKGLPTPSAKLVAVVFTTSQLRDWVQGCNCPGKCHFDQQMNDFVADLQQCTILVRHLNIIYVH